MATSAGDLIVPDNAPGISVVCDPCKNAFAELLTLDPHHTAKPKYGEIKYQKVAMTTTCPVCDLMRHVGSRSRWTPERRQNLSMIMNPKFIDLDSEVQSQSWGLCHVMLNQGTRSYSYGALRVTCLAGEAPILFANRLPTTIDLSLAAKWYAQCINCHSKCAPDEQRDLPTRVIDVGSDTREPRLVESRGLKGQYVTLSYCWGESQPMMTDSDNMASHMEAIPLHSMPATYRDAVAVTKALGFQYLWIDALCIIQSTDMAHHTDDWTSECLQMDTTYSNAALTISVPQAANASEGFLNKPRKVDKSSWSLDTGVRSLSELEADRSCQFSLPLPDGRTVELLLEKVYCTQQHHHLDLLFEGDVSVLLDRRGWALQERLLSPRLLEFRSAQMTFACNTSRRSEDIQNPIMYDHSQFSGLAIPKNLLFAQTPDVKLWHWLVENHTSRYLSYADDKLPSIAGVAMKLKHLRRDDEYRAGLWRNTLLEDLSWQRSGYSSVDQSKYPALFNQPSWSWASCKAAVVFKSPDIWFVGEHVFHATIEKPWSQSIWSNASSDNHDMALELTGYISPLCYLAPPEQKGFGASNVLYLPNTDNGMADVILDDIDDHIPGLPLEGGEASSPARAVRLLLLLTCAFSARGENVAHAAFMIALVQTTSQPNTFQRVGLAEYPSLYSSGDQSKAFANGSHGTASSPLEPSSESSTQTSIIDWFHSFEHQRIRLI